MQKWCMKINDKELLHQEHDVNLSSCIWLVMGTWPRVARVVCVCLLCVLEYVQYFLCELGMKPITVHAFSENAVNHMTANCK